MKKKLLVFVSAFCFAAFVFLAHFTIVGSAVWGDGQYYYAYLRSAVINKDLDFKNELEYFSREIELTKTGMVANKYSIGPAMLWAPFFLWAHFLVIFLSYFGVNIPSNGYSVFYQLFTGLGSVFYGILGLWFCFLTVKKYFDKKTALTSSLLLWLSSNLFFYTSVDPINSHSVSFFVASLVVYLVSSTPGECIPPSPRLRRTGRTPLGCLYRIFGFNNKLIQTVVFGILIGLLTLIRNQDVIFVIPIVFLFLSTPGEYLRTPLVCLYRLLIVIFSFSLAFLPQLFVWQYLYGQIFSPYLIGGEKFYWMNPKIFSVLFSQNNGLFYYSPILILALAGLCYFYKKEKKLALSFFLLFIVQTYIISSWHNWHGGEAYGGRMFISLYPFFIIGLAGFMDRLKKQMKILLPTFFFFVVLNFISIIKFLLSN